MRRLLVSFIRSDGSSVCHSIISRRAQPALLPRPTALRLKAGGGDLIHPPETLDIRYRGELAVAAALEQKMAKPNGQAPILIAGGGIGGLAAAHALARKGFAVRVLEQALAFREIGAGIQLGPNVFRALEKLDLKEAVLADAHRPPAMEMRC